MGNNSVSVRKLFDANKIVSKIISKEKNLKYIAR